MAMSERGQRAVDMCQWDRESMMILLQGFIREKGLEEELEEYLEAVAIEEMEENQPGWEKEDEGEHEDVDVDWGGDDE